MRVDAQIFVWAYGFNSFGYISEVGLLGHKASLWLTFWGTAKLFPKVTASFYIALNIYNIKYKNMYIYIIF